MSGGGRRAPATGPGGAPRELLRVTGLTRTFGGFAAVEQLSFHVEEGEVLGLVGPNGAGKTTTFNLVSGFLPPSAGRVAFRGEDVTGEAPHRLARRGLVRTFQHTRVFGELSVAENIRLACHKRTRGGARRLLFGTPAPERRALEARVEEVLAFVGLAARATAAAGDLAYGEQRVLEIAIGLAADPVLLMLDEPFAGMNEAESAATMRLIHRIRDAGVTVLVIDHHMETMARGCDRLLVMNYGVKLAEGAPAEVTRLPDVIEAYLGGGEKTAAAGAAPEAGAAEVLAFEGVRVAYGPVTALHGVNLEVRQGELVALVGGNGAGKTTALRAVSGLQPLAGGRIRFLGRELRERSPSRRVRDGLAHCPEGREIFPRMTVRDNLELGSLEAEHAQERLERVYELFPALRQRLGQLAGSLSGGEQQMLAIGRALMSDPQVLLLDEPSLGLAPLLVRELAGVLRRLNEEGTSILLVEQNAAMALALAHRAYVLENGHVVLQGAASELRENKMVRRVYLGA